MAREAIDVCLLMLKESNNRRFDSYSARYSVLISTFFRTTFLEIAVYGQRLPARTLFSLSQSCAYRRTLYRVQIMTDFYGLIRKFVEKQRQNGVTCLICASFFS